MELNSTLVIQAINFLCTYAMMHYIILRYAASSLQIDKKYTESLRSAIADRKIVLEQKLLEKEDHWRSCQHQLVKHEPSKQSVYDKAITQDEVAIPPEEAPEPQVSQEKITQAIKESVAYITKIGDLS